MTDYVRQHGTILEFPTNDSWVILNPIEQTIKKKIEKIGIPLKDWDISVNYGIKTGCNEAFIINKIKRDELIAKDSKSAELIRPILRGRDIKRYGYEFADQYIIATFPSKKYNIDDYPAVRDYLLQYGKKRLEQSGKSGSRKKTSHKWFETQDSIAYWEDFYKQKIAWNRIASEKLFSLVDKGIFIQDSMHFFTGNHLKYLCAILNSKLFMWFMYLIVGDAAGGNAGNADNVKNLTIPIPSIEQEQEIEKLLEIHRYKEIDELVYAIYKLDKEEIEFIKSL
jgi:hypothetical protein